MSVRPRSVLELFVLILSPFAPHLAEELWQALGHGKSLAYEAWPSYDPALLVVDEVQVPIQLNGKVKTVPAQQWVRDRQSRKELEYDWVFAGSILLDNVFEKGGPPFYGANGGDVICVSNFEDAMLDLPINSSKDNADLAFGAWTERIPPLETKVVVILEPVPGFKKPK